MKQILIYILVLFSLQCYSQQQMFLNKTVAAGGSNLLLDDYPGAAAAYAVMKLDNDYAGSCIRIRRDSDNAEQDIGFSGNDIDEASINSFCSGANCFVKTWYDQSGNGNNATQTTAANQPKVYDSAIGIMKVNSIASIMFSGDGSTIIQNLTSSNHILSTDNLLTAFILCNFNDLSRRQNIISQLSALARHGFWIQIKSYGASSFMGYAFPSTYYFNTAEMAFLSTGQKLVSSVLAGGTSSFYVDGSFTTSNASLMSAINTGIVLQIGGVTPGVSPNMDMQLIVIYNSDQSANRTAIETIINNYFSIY